MRASLVLIVLALSVVGAVPAQKPRLDVDPQNARPVLTLDGLLAGSELRNAVQSGLPIRIRVRVELWRDRLFDELKASESWSALIAYRPLEKQFVVTTQGVPPSLRTLPTFDAARDAVEAARTWTIRPNAQGRYYYTASVDVETLSLSDLEELERWLKGELKPAVSGDNSIPEAIGEGAKRLLIRVLALPTRSLELKTEKFTQR